MDDGEEIIRLSVVEDDSYLRDGLRQLISGAEGFAFSATFASVEEALIELPRQPVDVLLLDIGLPGRSGSDAVSDFRRALPNLVILMWTVYADRPKVFASICNGANGYLLKSTPPQQLLEAIRAAYKGGSPLSPEIASAIITVFRKLGPPDASSASLTPQEQRLLWLLAQGYSYESSGAQMYISVNTIRNYIRSIYQKLHVHSRSEAVTKALRQGLIG